MNNDQRSFSYRSNDISETEKKLVRLLILILVGVIIMYIAFNKFMKNEPKNSTRLITPSTSAQPTVSPPINEDAQIANESLKDIVENALLGTKGTYGIVVKNFKTGETYYANEHRVYEAGSLYKLWVMATAFNKIRTGAWKENQVLTEDVAVLNDKFYIDPDLAEQTEGAITLSVDQALEQMITISHNYAALLLTEKLKLSSVATFLKENNFNESKVGTNGEAPTITPNDTALFFEKLYRGELINQEYSNKMLDLLKRQQLDDKLPKYLPQSVVIAHKTGEIGGFTHDAGIVYSPNGDYVIVVLSESDSPPGAEERIAEVSKAVYTYFIERR